MAVKYFVFLALLSVISAQQLINGKIKVSTYSTAGCGDTVNFITQQLAPVYTEFGEFLDLEFVPWGRTVRNADGSLSCQFLERDCWANRLQRCVLDLLKDNQAAQMHYMNCEFTTPYPSFLQGTYICAQAVGVSLVDVDVCVATAAGDPLDAVAEALTQQPMQTTNFVPAIVFNDQIDTSLHTQARTSLRSMVCFALAQNATTGITNCAV